MAVKVWKQLKVTKFQSGNYRLSTCGQSATMATYDDDNELMEFMSVPKEILDAYAENYLAENFEMSEKDGRIRRIENDETV